MTGKEISKILKDIKWETISIIKDRNQKNVLILVCESQQDADNFFMLLANARYEVKGWINGDTKNFQLLISFVGTKYAIGCNTKKTEKNYPPLNVIKENKIDYITTGVLVGYNEEGSSLYNYKGVFSLFDKIHFN